MDRTELLDAFRRIASEIAEQDFGHLTEDSVIAKLGLDSLQIMELIGALEQRFEIEFPDEEIVGVHTVGQLLDLIERAKSARV